MRDSASLLLELAKKLWAWDTFLCWSQQLCSWSLKTLTWLFSHFQKEDFAVWSCIVRCAWTSNLGLCAPSFELPCTCYVFQDYAPYPFYIWVLFVVRSLKICADIWPSPGIVLFIISSLIGTYINATGFHKQYKCNNVSCWLCIWMKEQCNHYVYPDELSHRKWIFKWWFANVYVSFIYRVPEIVLLSPYTWPHLCSRAEENPRVLTFSAFCFSLNKIASVFQ